MRREYLKQFSESLQREMEILRFGWTGIPIIIFPTSCGRFYDAENFGMIKTLEQFVDANQIQIFCVDSIDPECLYNPLFKELTTVDEYHKLKISVINLQENYYLYIKEVINYIKNLGVTEEPILLGNSFGALHASNVSFRLPINTVIGIGGAYSLHYLYNMLDPTDFASKIKINLNALNDPNKKLNVATFYFLTGDQDFTKFETEKFFIILKERTKLNHELRAIEGKHDWETWNKLIQNNISSIILKHLNN